VTCATTEQCTSAAIYCAPGHLDAVAIRMRHTSSETITAARGDSQTGDTINKFEPLLLAPRPSADTHLDDRAAWFVGTILDRFPLGDHVGHLPEPVDGDPPQELEHWVFFGDVRHLQPGHDAQPVPVPLVTAARPARRMNLLG
jgi:hypothetical protein